MGPRATEELAGPQRIASVRGSRRRRPPMRVAGIDVGTYRALELSRLLDCQVELILNALESESKRATQLGIQLDAGDVANQVARYSPHLDSLSGAKERAIASLRA